MNVENVKKQNILLAYQERWLLDNSKVKVWQKSRRIGASYVEALFAVLKASLNKIEGGTNCYYISYAKDMTQQFIKDVSYWARLLGIACKDLGESIVKDEDKDITIYKVRFESGFEVWGLPSVPRSIRSKQGHIIIDEAAFCEDLNALLKAALAMLMWGGSVSVLSTHNGDDNAFNVLVNEIVDGKKDYTLFSTNIEEAITDGLYKRICDVSKGQLPTLIHEGNGMKTSMFSKYSKKSEREWLDKLKKDYGDAYEEELYCIPSRSGDKYFTRALLDTVKDKDVKVFRFYEQSDFLFKSEIERSRKVFEWFSELKNIFSDAKNEVVLGEDFGRSGDLTVLWFDEVIPSKKILTTQTLCVVELKNIPFSNQEAFIKLCVMELKNKFLGAAFDARGNGQMIAENLLIDYPAIILNVMLSRKWYAENFPRLKNAVEDGNTNIPNDDLIIADFLTAELFQGVPLIRERTGRGESKRHGDSLIAKLMATYALHELTDKRYQPMTYESVRIGNRYRIKGEADKWT